MKENKKLKDIQKILKETKEELRKRYKIREIGIFGSYARKEQKRGSDIDILVKFDKGASLFDLVGAEIFLQKKTGKKIDMVSERALRKELKPVIMKEVIKI